MKYLFFGGIILVFFTLLFVYQGLKFNDGKLHVTICDVGQGDAVYIRTPKGKNILFDAGPDKSVLTCLRKYMPFWERSIDLAILSHPHADHLNGFIDVFEVYNVKQFATEDVANVSDGYHALQEAVAKEKIDWQLLSQGDRIRTSDGLSILVLSPTREYIAKTAIDGKYITSQEFASLELLLSYGEFDVLLTGDSQHTQLQQAISDGGVLSLEVLQVPHHGSKTGLTEEILAQLRPHVATISVGENTYGHPAPYTLSLLEKKGVKILRTDRQGDLRLISDGKAYSIQ